MLPVGRREDGREAIRGLGFGWSRGMEDENELEEGEACSGQEDDPRIDPDVVLSYIDEKLQDVLGHFQKDFEGGVSAENLGAKFGGYGSFLPTYQRSPPISSQSRSSPVITDHGGVPRSPHNPSLEVTRQKIHNLPSVTTSLISRNKISAIDDSGENDKCESALNNRESNFPRNLLNKMANGGDQKTLKVRIKVCPDNMSARNNVAIYSGLGLNVSPSSSPEDSPTDSGGLSPEYRVTSIESPHTILQNMTCFPVPGGFLLSPLQGNALDLEKKSMPLFQKSKTSMLHKHASEPSAGSSKQTLPALYMKSDIVKTKADEKKGRPTDLKNSNCIDGISTNTIGDITQTAQELVSDATNDSLQFGLRETAGQAEPLAGESTKGSSRMIDHFKRMKNDRVKLQRTTPEFVTEKSRLECSARDVDTQAKPKLNLKATKAEKALEVSVKTCKVPVPDMHGENGKNEKNYNVFESDLDEYKGRIDQFLAPSDHVQQISAYKPISVVREREKVVTVKDQLFENERKHQGSQMQAESSTGVLKKNLCVKSSEAVNVKKKSSCSRTNQSEKKLKVKSNNKLSLDIAKESHGNVADEALENGCGFVGLYHKDKLKSVKPENEKEPISFREASKERPGNRKIDNRQISEAFVSEPIPVPTACDAMTKEESTMAPASVLINEEWVCCDSCQQWRLLPDGINPDDLPKTWRCIMLNWLPGMNSCNISQDEAEKAHRALYPAQAAENGINSDGHHDVASTITTGSALPRLEHNKVPVNRILKKTSEPRDVLNHLNSVEASNSSKKNYHASVMNRNSDDGTQKHVETCSLGRATMRHGYKSMDSVIEKQSPRHKEKHKNIGCYSAGGDLLAKGTKHSKLKSKRVLDQNDNRETKRIKKETLHDPVKDQDTDVDVVGKAISNTSYAFPTKASEKNSQKYVDVSLGNETHDSKAILSAPSKKSNAGKSDMQELFAKKRKLREWQGSERKPEPQLGFQQVLADQVVAKEALSESEVLKENKFMSPKSERKVSKVDGSLDSKASDTNLLPRSGHVVDELDDNDRICVGKEPLMGQCQGNPTSRQAMLSMDSLKGKDMAYVQASTAATSSSSKVSGSQRAQANFQEARGSPVESVSSSPLRIIDKRATFVKDETANVTTYVLGSPRRCSDSEVDEGKNQLSKERKDTTGFTESQFLQSHKQGRSGPLGPLGGATNYHDKEAEQLSGGKAADDFDLKKCFLDDLSPAKTGVKNMPSSSVILSDERSRYARGSSEKKHAQDLDKLKNNQLIDGGKSSSSRSKEKHRSRKFDVDKGKVKISGAIVDNMDSQFLKNGDSYREENYSNHFRRCSRSGGEDPNIQEKDGQGLLRTDIVVKSSSVHRREENRSSFGMQKSVDAYDHSLYPNQNHNLDPKAAVVDAKYDNSSVHECFKQIPSLQDEKSLIHSRLVENDRAELARGIGKTHFTRDKEETQKRGHQVVSSPLNLSRPELFSNDVNIGASKVAKQSRRPDIPNGVQQTNLRQPTVNGPDLSSPMTKDSSTVNTIFKEARDLKHTANRLKCDGLDLEATGLYFEAALKFLHAASLWEPSFDNPKQGDLSRSIDIYSETAKLCEFCAHEYERLKDMAAVALACKCVEVGYLKAAFLKYPGAIKDRQELQAAVQMFPPGESPSSSASDVDNLNNQGTLSKVATSKGVNSPQIAGHHVIAPRNHPHLMQLLAYTKDLTCAFEATRKSQIAIASASLSLEKYGLDAIASVRQVLDFNFHNVRGLLQLVRLSMKSIGH